MTTENAKVSRAIYQEARNRTRLYLKAKYHDEWARYVSIAKRDPKIPVKRRWHVAMALLIQKHQQEATQMTAMYRAAIELEVGYEPAPRGGHHTGRHAKVDAA